MNLKFRSVCVPLLTLLLTLLLAACGSSDPKNEKFVVAEGQGVKVTRGELNAAELEYLQQRGLNLAQVPPEKIADFEKSIAEQLVTEKLILQSGSDVKIPNLEDRVKQEVQAARGQFPDEKTFTERLTKAGLTPEILSTRIRKQITLQEILRAKVPVPAEPKPEDVKKFYQENEARFNEAAKVKASHILVRVTDKNTAPEKAALKKKADDARSRVAKGEDFAKVAGEVSDDVSNAKTGGDLGYFRKEEMVPEFSKVAFSSKVGTLSPVFETPYGYHFLKVTDTQAEKKHSFDEVQERLRGYLQDKGRGEVMKTYIEGLQKKAAVVYHFITVAAKPAEPSKP